MGTRSLANTLVVALVAAALVLGLPPSQAEPCDLSVAPGEDAQAALACASPGDVVLLEAGVHTQPLVVATPGLTVRGEGVGVTALNGFLAGGAKTPGDGLLIVADDVTVEDLTVRGFRGNGVFYDGVDGFLVQRVAAEFNGGYGVYAIRSTNGAFLDSFAQGHDDSGFYLGEVEHCGCLIANVTSTDNLLGYSGTGASDIVIRDSTWTRNAAGIVPNVLPSEPQPQFNLTITGNRVVDNNNVTAAKLWHFSSVAHVPPGLGIVIAGGSFDVVEGNTVTGHDLAGVAVAFLFTQPSFNVVRGNTLDNALDILWDEGGVNNCFEDNVRPGGAPATFDGGPVWNTLGHLPDCDTPNGGPASPLKLGRLASLIVFGCEPEEQPGAPCHLEGVTDDEPY